MTDTATLSHDIDVHDWLVRSFGVSLEDAHKIVGHIATETAERILADQQQTPAHTLASLAMDDQIHAAVKRVSHSVAEHYATLKAAGMPDRRAADLCADMQGQWLSGVLPVNEAFLGAFAEEMEGGE